MKISHAVGIAAVVGVGLGAGVVVLRLALWPWAGVVAGVTAASAFPPQQSSHRRGPVLVVEQTQYNFGKMNVHCEGRHDFLFANRGDEDLKLEKDITGCKCKRLEIEQPIVPPGATTKVTLVWSPAEPREEFRAEATIRTNDPNWPKVLLTARGRVIEAVRTASPALTFYHVSANEPTTREIPLYVFVDKQVKILDVQLDNPQLADHFLITHRPLTSAEVARQAGATGGHMIGVTIQPGLPLGLFQYNLLVTTDLPDARSVTIPVFGTVSGDIKIVGRDFNSGTRVLNLGTVDSRTGARRQLRLIVVGAHRDTVDFQLAEVFPDDVLQVSFGPRSDELGSSIQVPLIIEIPPGSREANHVGSRSGELGRITIHTTHPKTPELTILVSFAVKAAER